MKNNEILLQFLQNQKVITIASTDKDGKPWIFNAYYSVDKNMNFFFVSHTDAKHSQNIEVNPEIAFNIAWFDKENIENRKAIQGIGVCERVTAIPELLSLVKTYDKAFPEWKGFLTLDKLKKGLLDERPYVIRPNYIKFWNDELYGDKETEEFTF